jgi:hypothetical protein
VVTPPVDTPLAKSPEVALSPKFRLSSDKPVIIQALEFNNPEFPSGSKPVPVNRLKSSINIVDVSSGYGIIVNGWFKLALDVLGAVFAENMDYLTD